MIYERNNIRFSTQPYHPQDPNNTIWLADVTRISDGHWLPEQLWFQGEPTEEELVEAAEAWVTRHPGLEVEPPAVRCTACATVLTSDSDTKYQFDNALWIGFHGGYGMFTDTMADWPINTSGRYTSEVACRTCHEILHQLPDKSWVTAEGAECYDNQPHKLTSAEDPNWVPEYEEERILPGRPDLEAVICHECAHRLCEAVPWLGKLIDPHRSHSHTTQYHKDHPDHWGWDYDKEEK